MKYKIIITIMNKNNQIYKINKINKNYKINYCKIN
jgi:hypothetical protein